MNKQSIPQIVVSGMLLCALIPGHPYGYYILLRWVCCAVFGYLAFQSHVSKQQDWVWVLGAAAALYNPILPIHLTREIWSVLNIITIGIALMSIYALKSRNESDDQGRQSTTTNEKNRKGTVGPKSMTLSEAFHILDVLSEALQADDDLPYHPISSLKGYDVIQFDTALKLRIANDFLLFATLGDRRGEFEQRIKSWGSVPVLVLTQFVPDVELDEFVDLEVGSQEYFDRKLEIMPSPIDNDGFWDSRFTSLEMLSSFGAYCKHIGAADPMYWQNIYTRLNLPYTGASPRGNNPAWEVVELERC